ncbi:PPOX class F420-dependent oxidoreductase [Rugosimonospora africana]|uniref:PPOX class F420-dependent oxidoreductase n=1 Tax=Rugosimonospora africana TaxID=556532 RepID=A0A8J3QS32_9ACTN|nr:PPOX class F420-dependent oxidoreductase [Rugosimonospora africana]GIH14558.1 PPOX class F420-dependent oxidoreductase [Rugosimonospora africana]
MTVFTEREVAYLREQRLGRLATVQPNGTVQNNPVGFGYNEELQTIDIGGHNMAASQKFRNVAAGSAVAFVVDDVTLDPWTVRCLEIRGEAETVAEPTDSASPMGGPIIRIHPRRVLSFGVDPEAGRRTVTAG